jgi:hypothetical protein
VEEQDIPTSHRFDHDTYSFGLTLASNNLKLAFSFLSFLSLARVVFCEVCSRLFLFAIDG